MNNDVSVRALIVRAHCALLLEVDRFYWGFSFNDCLAGSAGDSKIAVSLVATGSSGSKGFIGVEWRGDMVSSNVRPSTTND